MILVILRDKGEKDELRIKVRTRWKRRGTRLKSRGKEVVSEKWIRGLDGDRGPKAAWHLASFISSHVTSPCHSPQAKNAAATQWYRNDNVQQRKKLNKTSAWAACGEKLESRRFASDLSISLMQRRPPNPLQANYMCWARAGAGHSLMNCSA